MLPNTSMKYLFIYPVVVLTGFSRKDYPYSLSFLTPRGQDHLSENTSRPPTGVLTLAEEEWHPSHHRPSPHSSRFYTITGVHPSLQSRAPGGPVVGT